MNKIYFIKKCDDKSVSVHFLISINLMAETVYGLFENRSFIKTQRDN